jgi:hypothetical protein
MVRRYAEAGLAYWPEDTATSTMTDLLHTRGASDVTVEKVMRTPGAADFIVPGLRSTNPASLSGAVLGVYRMLSANPPVLAGEARARAEAALISSADNVLRDGNPQTGNNYACALGVTHDPRARELLWSLIDRNLLTEQSLIAITWQKNAADLPRLASLLEAPAKGDPKQYTFASLPYAIHNTYGDAAMPVLERAVRESGYVWVQTNSARELIIAGRKAGFDFILQAIEENRFYKAEMIRFLQDRYPELKGADDARVLAFLRAR